MSLRMIHWIAFPIIALAMVALHGIAIHFMTGLTPRRTRTLKSAAQIRTLLNPPTSSLEALLMARAAPNQRLVHAFGLTNTFVSADPRVHKTFTTKAKALINNASTKRGGQWDALAHTTSAITSRFLPEKQQQNVTVDFATFFQCITLSVVLCSLFGADPETLRHDDIIYVTTIINKRWTDSKTKDPTTLRVLTQDDSLHRINRLIHSWIANSESDSDSDDRYPNPLDFILPAYETMWRVVAVVVAYIYRYRDHTLHDIVIAFGKDPTEARFECFEDDGLRPSAKAIVLEVLRLHPPTRHISRASTQARTEPGPEPSRWWNRVLGRVPAASETWVADIEGVQRSEAFGENGDEFDPMRFHPSRMQERAGAELFAFGYGRLGCIAAKWAPMAAAVIAARVIAEVEESGFTVKMGERIGGRSGWEGWMVTREI